MIRITLMDGSVHEISRSDARGIVPFAHVFSSPLLRAPIEGVICHKGKPLPILGPMPAASDLEGSVEKRAWILLMGDHAQVIRGLPEIQSATVLRLDEGPLADELANVLRSA